MVGEIEVENVKTGGRTGIPVQGVFVAVGFEPDNQLFAERILDCCVAAPHNKGMFPLIESTVTGRAIGYPPLIAGGNEQWNNMMQSLSAQGRQV